MNAARLTASPPLLHAEFLLRHFDTLADTPDAVAKLRALILQLAVMGKLVPQDPNDEPASVLLKKIAAEKARLVREGKIKPGKPLPPVDPEDAPFDLPEGWAWVRLGDAGYTQTGTTPKTGDVSSFGIDIPFIKPADIYPDRVVYDNERLSFEGVQKYGRLAPANSILMVCIGTIGKSNLIEIDCSFNQQINSVTLYQGTYTHLVKWFVRSDYFQDECWRQSSSTTISILNKGKWETIAIPLPPLAEQHRIVARVEQLMALCDQLEKQREVRREVRLRLNASTLNALTTAPDAEAFQRAWGRIRDHFHQIYAHPQTVAQLRQAILQLAVMGKLVPQDPNDEPASMLLKKIAAEKARLVREGKIKPGNPLPPVDPKEAPFDLPEGWDIVRFDWIAQTIGGVTLGRKLHGRETANFPYLRVANVQRGWLDLTLIKEIEIPVDELEKYRIEAGDLLITEGGDWDKVGRTAIWDGEIENCIHQNHIFKARLIGDTNKLWVQTFINSAVGRRYFENASKQTTNLASINMTQLRYCPLPLPPLAEQHRIVARVEQLMAVCDELETQLTQSRDLGQRLLVSVVAHLTETVA